MSKILQGFSVQSGFSVLGVMQEPLRSPSIFLYIFYLDALSVRRNAVLGQGGQIEACLPATESCC